MPCRIIIALLILLACPAILAAQQENPAVVIDLAAVPTNDGRLVRVHGSVGSGVYGVPVAAGWDCDDDGHEDYAFSAMVSGPLGRIRAGTVFLVFGDGMLAGSLDSAVPQARILRILGDGPSESTGSELWIDDVTGDGIGDLLIARQNYAPTGARTGAGALSILVGGSELSDHAATLAAVDLRDPPAELTIATFVGALAGDRLGMWMRTGDITGDGIADIVVAADQVSLTGAIPRPHHGVVFVIRGGPHLAATQTVDLASFGTTALAGHIARIDPPSNRTSHAHFGATCQIADLDGNGRAEVLIASALSRAGGGLFSNGGPATHGSGGELDGTLYIAWDDNFVGTSWAAGLNFEMDSAPGATTRINGGQRNIRFGEEILGGLDYDGDERADIFVGDIIGDVSANQLRPASGSGHVLWDAAALKGLDFDLDSLPSGVTTTTFIGAEASDIAADTAVHGDFDGDGIDDLAFSSPHGSPVVGAVTRPSAGILYVFRGRLGGWPGVIDLRTDALPPRNEVEITTILGAKGQASGDAGDTLMYSAAAGDLDGDGLLEIVTNEMLGNGVAPGTTDVGNLVGIQILLPEPTRLALSVAAFAAISVATRRPRVHAQGRSGRGRRCR